MKTRNIRRKQARRYLFQLAKWEKKLLPVELHKSSSLDKYEYLWETYYRHGIECFMPVPESVMKRLKKSSGKGWYWF